MSKDQKYVISVTTVFAGRQTQRQAFIDLILCKRRTVDSLDLPVDCGELRPYTQVEVFSDVRADRKEKAA